MRMSVHLALVAGWVPFSITILLVLLFSFVYVRIYQHKYEKELFSTVVSILGLAVALLTCSVMPVDIFLVSYMKNQDGTFKEWAENNETRDSIVNDVLYAYYALYSIVTLFLFFLLPLAYFYYEERDEDANVQSRCCTSLKYSAVFVFAALLLYLIGAFVPFRNSSKLNSNSTNWEDYFRNIFHDLHGSERWEDSISFTISALILFGMLNITVYTGYGMSSWPMDLVKGRRSTHKEIQDVLVSQQNTQAEIDEILQKYEGNRRRLNRRDRRRLDELESRLCVTTRRERHLEAAQKSCARKCGKYFRPLQIAFGSCFFLLAILVFISLLLTNIDKILHSDGFQSGYVLPDRILPNPIDITLVFAQKVFPLDYILMTGIILYFFFCSVSALKQIGIRVCCLRMYKIRAYKTVPQGLLFLCYLLMYIVIALAVLVCQLAPQYSMFGSQKYVKHNSDNTTEVVQCSSKAEASDCVMTRLSMLTTRFCFKFWFFGAAYFWISWLFLGMIVIGFLVSVIKKRRSVIEGEVEESDCDYSDDEELLEA